MHAEAKRKKEADAEQAKCKAKELVKLAQLLHAAAATATPAAPEEKEQPQSEVSEVAKSPASVGEQAQSKVYELVKSPDEEVGQVGSVVVSSQELEAALEWRYPDAEVCMSTKSATIECTDELSGS